MHATRFYKLLYYGCRAWQFSDNGFAGTTVGYVEWDHCWAFDNETEQGFILTQTPTELHIQLALPVYSGYYTLYNTTGSSVLRGPLLGNPVGKTEAPKAHSENSCRCTAGCC